MQKRTAIFAVFAAAYISACGGGSSSEVLADPNAGGGPGGGSGNTGSVSLSWQAPVTNNDGSTLSDLNGFRVYQGTTQNLATLNPIATISNASVSIYLVENLAPGTYYFSITAFNAQNLESELSNLVSASVN